MSFTMMDLPRPVIDVIHPILCNIHVFDGISIFLWVLKNPRICLSSGAVLVQAKHTYMKYVLLLINVIHYLSRNFNLNTS